VILDIRSIAHRLGGEVSGHQALVPGPGHGKDDRSLAIWLSPKDPDGFRVHSHSSDSWTECRDFVRSKLGLPEDAWKKERPAEDARPPN